MKVETEDKETMTRGGKKGRRRSKKRKRRIMPEWK